MSNLQTHYHFKLDFQKLHQHTWGKWLIHGTKHHKDNQKAWTPPAKYISRETSHKGVRRQHGQSKIQSSKEKSRVGNIQVGAHLQNQNY